MRWRSMTGSQARLQDAGPRLTRCLTPPLADETGGGDLVSDTFRAEVRSRPDRLSTRAWACSRRDARASASLPCHGGPAAHASERAADRTWKGGPSGVEAADELGHLRP